CSTRERGVRMPCAGATGENRIVKVFIAWKSAERHRHHRVAIDDYQWRTGAICRIEEEGVGDGRVVNRTPRVHVEFHEGGPDAAHDRGNSFIADRRGCKRWRERRSDHCTDELALRVVYSERFGAVVGGSVRVPTKSP